MGEQFRIDPETTRTVKAKYAAIRESRNDDDVERTLAALSKAAASDRENILPYLVDCCHAYATVGEMVSRLRAAWGAFEEPIRFCTKLTPSPHPASASWWRSRGSTATISAPRPTPLGTPALRERMWQSEEIEVGAGSVQKKT